MRMLVLGDAMEDVYWDGSIRRINPEKHSAPLVRIKDKVLFPGGAANVVKNLKMWGIDATLVSGSGSIIKNRIIDSDGVICRFDVGDELSPAGELPKEKFDAVIVSDYGKGTVLQSHVKSVREYGCPIFVDTKTKPYPWAPYATCLFPNSLEFSRNRIEYREAKLIFLKQGEDGASFVRKGVNGRNFPSLAKEVRNVSGAGDTVIAAFAMWYTWSRKACPKLPEMNTEIDAAKFAMQMAAVAVSNKYTHAPTLGELSDMFPGDDMFHTMYREIN